MRPCALATDCDLADGKFQEEQLTMNDCYSDHKDWRICKKEVRRDLPLLVGLLTSILDGGI
jgi:hypothetical protein